MQVTALTYAKKDIKNRNLAPWQKTTFQKVPVAQAKAPIRKAKKK